MKRPALLLLLLVLLHVAHPAAAKDGDSGSSGSNSSGSNSSGDDDDGGDDEDDDDEDDEDDGREDDSHRAKSGVSSGEILPLSTILSRLHSSFDGRLLDAQLKRSRGREIYELQIITAKGRVLEVRVDAATAKVLGYEVD